MGGSRAALWLGPDEWLLLMDEMDAAGLMRRCASRLVGTPHSLVDVSHAYAGLMIDGRQAASVLSHGCPLDLSLPTFPVGMCTRTILSKAQIVLWRTATESFHVGTARSLSVYVLQFLEESLREYRS